MTIEVTDEEIDKAFRELVNSGKKYISSKEDKTSGRWWFRDGYRAAIKDINKKLKEQS